MNKSKLTKEQKLLICNDYLQLKDANKVAILHLISVPSVYRFLKECEFKAIRKFNSYNNEEFSQDYIEMSTKQLVNKYNSSYSALKMKGSRLKISRMSTKNKLMTDDRCWEIITSLEWSKDYDYDRIAKILENTLSTEEANYLSNWVTNKVGNIYNFEKRYAKKYPAAGRLFGVSDDSFNDLANHIVGLGKQVYEAECNSVELLRKRAKERNFEENFHYSFQYLYSEENKI